MGNPQGVIEPRVDRTGIDEVGQGKLMDSPQPLQRARTDQLHLLFSQSDEVVHRVADIHFQLRPPESGNGTQM